MYSSLGQSGLVKDLSRPWLVDTSRPKMVRSTGTLGTLPRLHEHEQWHGHDLRASIRNASLDASLLN
jgi:hypothetical protein